MPVFYLGSKIFLSRTQLLAKLQGQRLSYFLLLLTTQLIKLINKASVFI